MRRVFITVHLKNILLSICIGIGFILTASFLILGFGNDSKSNDVRNDKISQEGVDKKNTNSINKINNKMNLNVSKVRVYISEQNNIREMDLEEYVKGVVSAEMPANFDIEALKAQAVAARTYTLAHIKAIGGNGCKNAHGGDLCDTVHCQVYMTKEERMKMWPQKSGEEYWQKISAAVAETSGQVLTYNNELVMEPYYFSTSSGKTEDAAEAFSNNIPYLRSVDSPGEERSPKYKSSFNFTNMQLSSIINKKYPNAKISLNSVKKQISVLSRTTGGSVKEIKIGNEVISGDKFRFMLGLNSANFDLNFNEKSVDVKCSGYGHGVGMSQWGADAMAKEGKTYLDILCHYYQDVEIQKIN